jgi:hypothetical protein
MPSYQVRNRQQEGSPHIHRAKQAKLRETSIETVDTSSESMSPIVSRDPNDCVVAQKLVKDLTDDIVRSARDYGESVGRKAQRKGSSGSFVDPADEESADESKTHWVDQDKDQVQFSVEEIKHMVMESLPSEVRNMVPPDTWDRIFNEASEDDIISLQRTTTEEEISDLVSYVSAYVKREARVVGRTRGDSDVSEMTHPNVEQPGRPVSRMDAVALIVPTLGVIAQGNGYGEDEPMDVVVERRESRHTTIDFATGQPTQSLSMDRLPSPKGKSSTFIPPNTQLAKSAPSPPPVMAAGSERQVGFSCIEIRYYEQVMGDNPAVTSGPPVGLGWKYRSMKNDVTVDAWERRQSPNRRYLTGLVITRHERTHLLYDLGYSQREIALGVRDVLRIKSKRKQTYNNLRFQNMEEMMESSSRRFKSVLTLGLIKRKEKKMLAPFKNN